MTTNIYVLCELDGEIRYIGRTGKTIEHRFSNHLAEAKRGDKNHRLDWIRSVLSKGFLPLIRLIGRVEGDGVNEETVWIAYGKEEGWRLVNGTDKGSGGGLRKGHIKSEETRRKLSIANKGKKRTKEVVERMKKMSAGKCYNSKEHFARLSIMFKGKPLSPEHRLKIGLANKGKHYSAEICKRFSERQKGKHPSVETLHKMRDVHKRENLSEETRKRISEGVRDVWRKRKELKAI